MSDRMYIVCKEHSDFCEESDKKKLIAKRFTLEIGWRFMCIPSSGLPFINADSKEELIAQLKVGGLNCKEKETLVMVATLNEWFKKHQCCKDFALEMDI